MSELKKNGIDFLSNLEGYHQALKGIHWSTKCKAEHLLTDDIDEAVLEYEDKLAENLMGCGNFRYGVGDLKTMLPSAKGLAELLSELQDDVNKFEATLDTKKHEGIINITGDFCEDINKWKYLATFN